MNCVHNAFVAHAEALGVKTPYSFHFYEELKQGSHGVAPQYTWSGALPFFLGYLGRFYGLRVASVQHKLWTPDHYVADAPTQSLKRMAQSSEWGVLVDEITLAPAVYALYLTQHATYASVPPLGDWVTIAVQLERTPVANFMSAEMKDGSSNT